MTDITKENARPLIETEEFEEEISLVSSEQDTNISLLTSNKPATLESNASSEWDDHTTKKELPLSATIVVEEYDSDPWAQPENALLAVEEDDEDEDEAEELVVKQPYQPPATATVFDAIDAHPEPTVITKEDQDTSAIKVIFFIGFFFFFLQAKTIFI